MAIIPDDYDESEEKKAPDDDGSTTEEQPPPFGGVQRVRRRRQATVQQNMITPMRSIRRGSLDWQTLIRPFVSELCFKCLVKRRSESDISFQSWSGLAAVLFVDLSSYSKITTAIAHKGAYVLSNVVNAYLDRLLKIAKGYGGDVVKFAGDAVLIVWEAATVGNGESEEESLKSSVLCAAQCVMAMQQQAGNHPVEGTDLAFQIHCGLTCGELETEVFVAPTHLHMQRLYHSVGGLPMQEIGDLVDYAKAGEVCVSEKAMKHLGSFGTFRRVNRYTTARILESLECTEAIDERVGEHIDKLIRDREAARLKDVEEDFIHPGVLKLLTHSGQEPTQIAQMRNLCVLFIAQTSTGNPVNWLMEIQAVLDTHRCPIIQIIDDDKGVHLVSALNLYESVPEPTVLALDICSDLIARQVGCAVGVAMGSSFCGVTGSATVSCRWDITGAAVVRAARLMQFALQDDLEVAIDMSVYNGSSAAFRMTKARSDVILKGSTEPINVFTLSQSTKSTANMILETLAVADVHRNTVEQVAEILQGDEPRGVVLLTGPPFAGKKAVLQRAAGLAGVVPVLHTCDYAAGHLQLARTIATWFAHYQQEDVRELARNVMEHLEHKRWSRAHDECILLVNKVIAAGYCGCFVVDRCQFLDDFSISLIRECLDIRLRAHASKHGSSRSIHASLQSSLSDLSGATGRMFFLCTHVPLYHWRCADAFVRDLKRTRNFDTPIFEVGAASQDEFREWLTTIADLNAEPGWLKLYHETTGGMIGYFSERTKKLRLITSQRLLNGKRGVTEISEDLTLFVPPKMIRINRRINVIEVSAPLAMRFTQIFDELPPRFQTFMKVVAIATRCCHFKCPMQLVKNVLYDIITADGDDGGVSLDATTAEMEELYLIRVEPSSGLGCHLISVYCPALSDVIFDVCTPAQIQYISRALIDRLLPWANRSFRVPLAIANLYGNLGRKERQIEFWKQSYEQAVEEAPKSGESVCWYKSMIDEEIEEAGFSSKEVLGKDFCYWSYDAPSLPHIFIASKNSVGPFSFGPLGHSLSVILRFVAREITAFHGATEEEIEILRSDAQSAFDRYKLEMRELENYMKEKGCGADDAVLDAEIEFLEKILRPAESGEEVHHKVDSVLKKFTPEFTEARRRRLFTLVQNLNEEYTERPPCVILHGPKAICEAYKALRATKDRTDGLQDALVTLASSNWVPKKLPEYLPVMAYQTVANVRDLVLRRLSQDEKKLFGRQDTIDDFEAFLVTTALLYESCSDCRRVSLDLVDGHRSSWLSSQKKLTVVES